MNIRRMKMKILAYLLCCEFSKHSNPRHSVKDIRILYTYHDSYIFLALNLKSTTTKLIYYIKVKS